MYIRRKVFSVYLDEETGEERLFSTTEFIDEERYFSEDVRLEDISSNRGLGRSFMLGATVPGAVGGYFGKKEANRQDRLGASDDTIISKARNKAALVGAGTGAVLGTASSLAGSKVTNKMLNSVLGTKTKINPKLAGKAAGKAALTIGALGALGGYAGAGKNTKDRLAKRNTKIVERERLRKELEG